MLHSDMSHMIDDLLESPDELLVSSHSKHCALYSTREGALLLLEGNFSGNPKENEEEVHHILAETGLERGAVA